MLLGKDNVARLKTKHVLVVGLGGVGAYAAEMIARAGIGTMTIIDGDVVAESNINRQLPALHSTIGKSKAVLLEQRLKDINPKINLNVIAEFVKGEQFIEILKTDYDYIVDAIDTLSPKVNLIFQAVQKGLPIISSMGAGGKTDPTQLKIADISKSHNCKLARALRKRLGKLGIRKGVDVVFSTELPNEEAVIETHDEQYKKSTVGTISYLPPIFGIYCASKVIQELSK
jgi:tRNA A37 threonylcarbamoyladenosine dehydratase